MSLFKRRRAREQPDRYRTLDRIGEGGEAVIARAFDSALHRMIAVKELKSSGDAPGLAQRTFVREARLVCYLDHPCVVPIYDRYQKGSDPPCYVMKLIDGDTLSSRLQFKPPKAGRALPVAEAVGVLTRLAETLAYAHDRGVVHLDLKPDNVMIGRYGELFLMDWGNARLFDPAPYRAYLGENARDDAVALLVDEPPDLLSGTPHFMSPEQTHRPRDTLGPPSDVFSAGVLLYLSLTGRLPFRGKDVEDLFDVIREDEPAPLVAAGAGIPLRLTEICARMLAKEEEARYGSFHEVLADIAAYQDAGQGFPTRSLEKDQVLFEEGVPGDGAYLVVSGRVAILKHSPQGERQLSTLGPGEAFGEISIFSDQTRTATVKALEPTELRFLSREEIESELAKIAPWVGAMITTLADRFVTLTDEVLRLKERE